MPLDNRPEEQKRATRLVRVAINKGELIRPSLCERCMKPGPIASDGRATIHAHHAHGYHEALKVEWLCARCHRAETPLPAIMGAPCRGEKNGQSRLSEVDVALIRASEMGCRRLGALFGVNKTTIQRVRNGKRWLAVAPTPIYELREVLHYAK